MRSNRAEVGSSSLYDVTEFVDNVTIIGLQTGRKLQVRHCIFMTCSIFMTSSIFMASSSYANESIATTGDVQYA